MQGKQNGDVLRNFRATKERVFLSCSGKDVQFALEVSKYLKPYVDQVDISTLLNTPESAELTKRAIRECSVFICMFGKVVDAQQNEEIGYAINSGTKHDFLICLLDGVTHPQLVDELAQLSNRPRLTSNTSLDEAQNLAVEIKKYIPASTDFPEDKESVAVVHPVEPDRAMSSSNDHGMCSSNTDASMETSFNYRQVRADDIESMVHKADALVRQNNYTQARHLVRGLTDKFIGPGISDLVQSLLQQIDQAEDKHKTGKMATAAIDKAQRFISQGDFEEAKQVIGALPNQIGSVKREIIGQINAAADQWRKASIENEQLISRLDSLGLDTAQVVGALAAKNNLDSKNQLAVNAILKTILNHVPQPSPNEAAEPMDTSVPAPPKQATTAERSTLTSSSVPQNAPTSRIIEPCETFPHASVDSVEFSITSPPAVLPGSSYMIDVWAHLTAEKEEVLKLARIEAGSDSVAIRSEGPFEVKRGTILKVRLNIQDIAVEPTEKSIHWQGGIGKAGFFVSVPPNLAKGSRKGVAAILIDSVPVVKIFFIVEIREESAVARTLPIQTKRYHKAFISYASGDKDAVLARVQGLRKGLPNLDVFWPDAHIESGAKWRETLAQEILSRDVMYLFWSVAASKSQWVDWEWRFAYQKKGIEFIDPCPLVSPEIAPPPKELADHLHFNDWALAYMAHNSPSVTRAGAIARATRSIKGTFSSLFRRGNKG